LWVPGGHSIQGQLTKCVCSYFSLYYVLYQVLVVLNLFKVDQV
jgi:hypothetical protein